MSQINGNVQSTGRVKTLLQINDSYFKALMIYNLQKISTVTQKSEPLANISYFYSVFTFVVLIFIVFLLFFCQNHLWMWSPPNYISYLELKWRIRKDKCLKGNSSLVLSNWPVSRSCRIWKIKPTENKWVSYSSE